MSGNIGWKDESCLKGKLVYNPVLTCYNVNQHCISIIVLMTGFLVGGFLVGATTHYCNTHGS